MVISHIPSVQGERTVLRALTAQDEQTFLSAARASVALHGDWVVAPQDASAFAAYVGRRAETFVPLLLVHAETRALLGVFNLSQIFMGSFCSAYLGYYAFAPHHRQGFMGEGLQLLLRIAFGALGLHRVEANIQPENGSSIALARRAGFQREGLSPGYLYVAGAWRDHERWAMRRELWSAATGSILG